MCFLQSLKNSIFVSKIEVIQCNLVQKWNPPQRMAMHCIGNGKVESEFIFNSFPKLPNCALFHLNESKLGWCKLINSKLYFPADWFSKFQTYLHPGNNVQRKKDWFSERKMFRFLCLESDINSQRKEFELREAYPDPFFYPTLWSNFFHIVGILDNWRPKIDHKKCKSQLAVPKLATRLCKRGGGGGMISGNVYWMWGKLITVMVIGDLNPTDWFWAQITFIFV